MDHLTIGALAKEAHVNLQTIRDYEREGLIAQPARTASGYRMFAPDVVRRVRFVKHAQELGFSLAEVRELLALRVDPKTSCTAIRQRTQNKIADVQNKIRCLQVYRKVIRRACGSLPWKRSSNGMHDPRETGSERVYAMRRQGSRARTKGERESPGCSGAPGSRSASSHFVLIVMTGCSAQKNVAASLPSSAVTKTMFIPAEGISCGSCAATVKRRVKRVDGVTDVEVSLEHRGARVRYTERRVTPTRLWLRSISSVTKLAVRRWNHDDSGCVSGEVCLQSAP